MKAEEMPVVVGGGIGGCWGQQQQGARPCDTCGVDAARLYCRTDGAYLCGGCDARAHGHGGGGSRHARVWLCEVCEQAPASVTCRADAAALCAACDADIHSANPLAGRHERVPVAPFFGALADAAPAQKEEEDACDGGGNEEAEAASWLLPEPGDSPEVEDTAAAFFADSDAYLGLDLDFVRSMDGIKAIGVPVASSELDLAAAGTLFYPDHSMNHSVSSSEVAVVPDAPSVAEAAPSTAAVVVSRGKDREARLMRYREKRKNRRFHKTIRYASRKAYAETRPRIKGRFAKRAGTGTAADDDALEQDDGPFSPAVSALVASDGDYGIVPSF